MDAGRAARGSWRPGGGSWVAAGGTAGAARSGWEADAAARVPAFMMLMHARWSASRSKQISSFCGSPGRRYGITASRSTSFSTLSVVESSFPTARNDSSLRGSRPTTDFVWLRMR